MEKINLTEIRRNFSFLQGIKDRSIAGLRKVFENEEGGKKDKYNGRIYFWRFTDHSQNISAIHKANQVIGKNQRR